MRADFAVYLALLMACGPASGTSESETSADGSTSSGTSSSSASGQVPTTAADETTTVPGTTSTSTSTSTGTSMTASETSTTTSGSDATSEMTSTTTPGSDATSEMTSTGPGMDSDPSTSTGETMGDPACEEPEGGVMAEWSILVDGGPAPESLVAPCTVITSDLMQPVWLLALECTGNGEMMTVEFEITRAPGGGKNLFPGNQVMLAYRSEQIFWTNRWFSIRPETEPEAVAVSGISADKPIPEGTTAEEFFGLTKLAVIDGACDPIDGGGACEPTIRMALDVAWSTEQSVVFDGHFDALFDFKGDLAVWVARATRPADPQACDDVPPAWFEVVTSQVFGP